MPFSSGLKKCLSKGQFPLKSSDELRLWEELVVAMEKSPKQAVAEALALKTGTPFEIFNSQVVVNGVTVNMGGGELAAFIGSMHAALMTDFDIYNRKGDTTVQDLAKRVRKIAKANNVVKVSSITLLPLNAKTKMGQGLVTKDALTFLPDPSLYGAEAFGSQPDQKRITQLAPLWGVLKKRRQVKAVDNSIGKKPHYVLAHLLNHQVNGSGADPANVVPFSSDRNTEMALTVEVFLKDLVQRGVPVRYTIQLEAAVGMTPGRQAARNDCTTNEQRAIIDAEQHLPAALVLSLAALDASSNNWLPIVSGKRIENFVPETVPVI